MVARMTRFQCLLGLDGGDGAVVDGLLDVVLKVGSVVNNDLGNAVIVDAEHVSGGGLAQTATDALLVNGNLHVGSSHSCRAHALASSMFGPHPNLYGRTLCPLFYSLLYTLLMIIATLN